MSVKVADDVRAMLRTSDRQVLASDLQVGMQVWGQGTVVSATHRGRRIDVSFGVVTHAYKPDEPVLLDG